MAKVTEKSTPDKKSNTTASAEVTEKSTPDKTTYSTASDCSTHVYTIYTKTEPNGEPTQYFEHLNKTVSPPVTETYKVSYFNQPSTRVSFYALTNMKDGTRYGDLMLSEEDTGLEGYWDIYTGYTAPDVFGFNERTFKSLNERFYPC